MRRRVKNVDEVRDGRIPEELQDSDRAFLMSLDTSTSSEFKKHRYSLMADLEEHQAKMAEEMFRTNDRAANDQKIRADKYRKAAQEPWTPVEPPRHSNKFSRKVGPKQPDHRTNRQSTSR